MGIGDGLNQSTLSVRLKFSNNNQKIIVFDLTGDGCVSYLVSLLKYLQYSFLEARSFLLYSKIYLIVICAIGHIFHLTE